MKIKPSKKSGSVVVELNPGDSERLSQGAPLANGTPPPFKLTKILVPIDFSDCSKKALQYAVPFAKQFGATITLLQRKSASRNRRLCEFFDLRARDRGMRMVS